MSMKRAAAHSSARRGFNVFPIRPYVHPGEDATDAQKEAAAKAAKTPLITNWQNKATQDPKQIDAWWDEWPDANIAGTTENLVVIDIDPRHKGDETFQFLTLTEDFDKTLRSRTAGGGDHIIYASPERPVKGGTNKLGQGVDVKARGGYILLPGSVVAGNKYEWGNDRPIARAMPWLVERCQAARAKTDVAGKRLVEEDETAIELATQWMLKRAPTAYFGEIDDTTYKVATRLYDFGVSVETATDIMLEWNETHCFPPGDTDRLLVVTESAGRNRENAIGSAHPLAPGFNPVEIDESKAPPVSAEPMPSTESLRAENFFAAADLALTSAAEPLIKGVLDRGAMSILYGESNTGKTFIAIDMAFHIALGRPWTGRKTRRGCVVYVAAEGGRGVYKRLAALRKANPDLADVPLFVVKYPIDLLHGPEHGKALVEECRRVAASSGYELELIVVDTLSRAMSGGDENSSTDMGGIVKSFDALREVTGAHLMVIHHSGKDRAKGARGHSLLRAATDTEIEVERGRVTVTKQRDMDGDFKQAFRLRAVNIGADPDGGWVSSCVVECIAGQEAGAVVVPLTKTQLRTLELIRKHIGNDPEKVFGWEFVTEIKIRHDSGKGASRQAVTEILEAISGTGELRKLQENQYVLN